MESASVIISAGKSESDDELLECLTLWSSRGWLQDFLWAALGDPEDVSLSVSNGEQAPLNMEDFQGGVGRVLRYVAVQMVPHGPVQAGLQARAAALAEELYLGTNASAQRLIRIGLIVPSAETPISSLSPEAVFSTFEANVVLSPEDRPSLRGFRIPIDAGARFVPHAALGVVSLSGLWRGCRNSPFDNRGEDGALAPRTKAAMAAVSAARVMHGHLTVHDVAAQLLEWTRALPPDPLVASELFESLPMPDEHRWLSALASNGLDVLGEGELRRHQPPPRSASSKGRRGIRATLLHFLGFVWDRLRQAPNAAIERVVARAENAVQRAIPGEEANYLVRLGGRTRSDDLDVVSADDLTLAARSAFASLAPDAPLVAAARPVLWQELRMLCFGLVDGGRFPGGITAPEMGKRLVPRRASIAPIPPQEPQSLASLLGLVVPPESPLAKPLPLVDPRELEQLRQWVEQAAEPWPPSNAESVEGSEVTTESIIGLIDEIVRGRESSLLWKLASGLSRELDGALEGAQASMDRIKKYSVDLQRDKHSFEKEPRAIRWARRISTGLFGLLAIAPIAVHLLWSLLSPDWLKDLVDGKEIMGIEIWSGIDLSLTAFYGFIWPLLWRVSLLPITTRLWSWVSNVRRQYKIKVRFDDLPDKLDREAELLRFEVSEVHRLSSVYARFVDWSAAIAWPLHQPYGQLAEGEESRTFELDAGEVLPRSMRVMHAKASELRIGQLSGDLVKQLLRPGWLTTAFEQSAHDLFAQVRAEFGVAPDQVLESLNNSISGVEVRRFTEAVASQDFARRQAEIFCSRVTEKLARREPEDLFDSARELSEQNVAQGGRRGPDPRSPSVKDFLAELLQDDGDDGRPRNGIGDGVDLWTESARAEASRRSATHLWAAPSVQAGVADHDIYRVNLEASATAEGSLFFLAARVDLTEDVDLAAFKIFSRADARQTQKAAVDPVEPTTWA